MTSKIEAAKAAISMLDSLRVRALTVVANAPHWHFVSEPNFALLDIDGEEAVLTLCSTGAEWDSATLETEVVRFPADLLFIGQEEFEAWKSEQKAIYDQKQKNLGRQRAVEREVNERAALRALKLKYDTP